MKNFKKKEEVRFYQTFINVELFSERKVEEYEKLYEILQEWEHDRQEVKFFLRHKRPGQDGEEAGTPRSHRHQTRGRYSPQQNDIDWYTHDFQHPDGYGPDHPRLSIHHTNSEEDSILVVDGT